MMMVTTVMTLILIEHETAVIWSAVADRALSHSHIFYLIIMIVTIMILVMMMRAWYDDILSDNDNHDDASLKL